MTREAWVTFGIGVLFLGVLAWWNYEDPPSRELWKGNPGPYLRTYFHVEAPGDAGGGCDCSCGACR